MGVVEDVSFLQRVSMLFERLTEPYPDVVGNIARRQAKLLATVLLLFVPFAILFISVRFIISEFPLRTAVISLTFIVAWFIAYRLSRTHRHQAGAMLINVALSGAIFFSLVANPNDSIGIAFFFISSLLAIYLMPMDRALIIGIANIFGVVLLALVSDYWTIELIQTDLIFLVIASLILLVIILYRQTDVHFLEEQAETLEKINNDLSQEVSQRVQMEASLQESEAFTRAIFDALSAQIAILDDMGKIVSVNQAWREVTQRQTPDIIDYIGLNYLEICDHESSPVHENARLLAQAIRDILEGKQDAYTAEYLSYSIEDTTYWVMVRVTLFQMKGKRHLVIAHEDITEQKLAEQAIRQSETKFSTIFESSPDPVIIFRLDDAVITDVNSSFIEVTQYDLDDVIGKTTLELNLWADNEKREQFVEILERDGIIRDFEMEFLTKLGQVKLASVSSQQVTIDGVPHLLSIARDVTVEQYTAQQLQQQAYLLENVSDAIISTDNDFNILSWNRAAEQIYGWTAEEAIGQPMIEIAPTTYADSLNDEVGTTFGEQGFWSGEVIQTAKNGEALDIFSAVTLLKDQDGNPNGAVAVNREITSRKEAEHRQKALLLEQARATMLRQFITNLSHDFRTPLSIINTKKYLLDRQLADDKQKQHLQTIDRQVNIIEKLIDRMLTMIRLDIGVEFSYHDTYLNSLVRDIQVRVEGQTENCPPIELDLCDDLPTFKADSSYLGEVVFHILENAIEHTPSDKSVMLRTAYDEQSVCVEIQDSGKGIPDDALDKVFDYLYRQDEARGLGDGHVGLGLSIAKRIVELHNGEIILDSVVGEGTTVTIRFPRSVEPVLPTV